MKKYRFPILSGILIGTSYIPFPPWALFFCLTPLFYFWWKQAERPREALFAGWITQFVLNLIGFHWIAHTAVEFGHFPWWAGILVLVGFAAIAHLYYPVSGCLSFLLIKRLNIQGPSQVFIYALSFVLCDALFTKIFPWHLGYPWLWANWPGAQFSDVIGFEGLAYVTVLVNAFITWSVVEGLLVRREGLNRRKAWTIAGIAGLLIGGVNLAGWGRETPWKKTDAELRAVVVQGNIGNFEKYMAELQYNFGVPIVKKYTELSRQAHQKFPEAHVMMWPETAFPRYLDRDYNTPLAQEVRSLVRELRLPLITGSYSAQFNSPDVYNGLFFLDADGGLATRPYRKSILLVFGETFPFSDYIPYMDKFFPNQGSFGRGTGPTVWTLNLSGGNGESLQVNVGPQICYEGLYPWFSAEMARNGAQIFANVTNDSWFGTTFEPYQHLYMTLARAIEFRRPLIRSTNTGISTVMLASGEILHQSPLGEEWWSMFRIPYQTQPEHTFYERYGFLWPWILASLLVLTVVYGVRFERGSTSIITERS